ncbi:MAG: hypothetical protein KC431_11920, partial [Myxococcales bacterium]|nr:hypothetical protein [Myxococcales bacterium]
MNEFIRDGRFAFHVEHPEGRWRDGPPLVNATWIGERSTTPKAVLQRLGAIVAAHRRCGGPEHELAGVLDLGAADPRAWLHLDLS